MNILDNTVYQLIDEIYSCYEIMPVEKHNELLVYCAKENKLISYIDYTTKILTVYHREYVLSVQLAGLMGVDEPFTANGLLQLRDSKNDVIGEITYKNNMRHGKGWQIDTITRAECNFIDDSLHGCLASYMVCDNTMYDWDWFKNGVSIKEQVCEILGVPVEYESLTEAEITFVRCAL